MNPLLLLVGVGMFVQASATSAGLNACAVKRALW